MARLADTQQGQVAKTSWNVELNVPQKSYMISAFTKNKFILFCFNLINYVLLIY